MATNTPYKNKYIYLHIVQGNYGAYGWEDIDCSVYRKEARDSLRTYRLNAPEYSYRLIQRRELNPE